MKIGLVCQSCDNRTGIGRIVNALALEFIELGHEVSCTAQFFDGTDTRLTKHRVPSLPSKGLNKLLFRFSGPAFERKEFDVVHTFGVGKGADVVSAQSCHRAGMRLLHHMKGEFLERRNFGFYDRVSLVDERRLLTSRSTRRIIAASQLVKSQIEREYGVDPSLISIVPNGVNHGLFQELRDKKKSLKVRSSLGFSDDRFVVLFVGNEFGRKGLTALLHAIKALHDDRVSLLVVGGGERESYQRLAVDLGIADKVRFLGSIPNPELMYMAADAFVLPALYEPFGIVILEAMAAGVPVITSRSCGATEGMQHRRHILHLDDPTSAEELSEAIRLLVRDGSLRESLIAAGIEKSREFSWNVVARKILSVYDTVGR